MKGYASVETIVKLIINQMKATEKRPNIMNLCYQAYEIFNINYEDFEFICAIVVDEWTDNMMKGYDSL